MFRVIITGVKYTFLVVLLFAVSCSRQPDSEPKSAAVESDKGVLDFYDVSLNTESVTKGQQISFCFKAKNAVMARGFPGKFLKNGALTGDCLIHTPEIDTLYNIEVTGADGTKRSQSAFVRVRK